MTRADDYLAAKGHRTLLLNGGETSYTSGNVRSLGVKRKTVKDGVKGRQD